MVVTSEHFVVWAFQGLIEQFACLPCINFKWKNMYISRATPKFLSLIFPLLFCIIVMTPSPQSLSELSTPQDLHIAISNFEIQIAGVKK